MHDDFGCAASLFGGGLPTQLGVYLLTDISASRVGWGRPGLASIPLMIDAVAHSPVTTPDAIARCRRVETYPALSSHPHPTTGRALHPAGD